MSVPSPSVEKRLLKTLTRGTFSSVWWKSQKKHLRRCPRCGGPLSRRLVRAEGRRRHVCRRCRHIVYENPKLVGATLPLRRGKVYLLRRSIEPSYGKWTFPAGYMELGETVEEAAARETREEIRCRVKRLRLQGIYSFKDTGAVTILYRANVVGPEPRPGPEALCVRAFRPQEIPWEELAFKSTYHGLRDWATARRKGNG